MANLPRRTFFQRLGAIFAALWSRPPYVPLGLSAAHMSMLGASTLGLFNPSRESYDVARRVLNEPLSGTTAADIQRLINYRNSLEMEMITGIQRKSDG